MKKTADAVVIGGGILGASTAHFLAKKGFGRIVLLEKRTLAAVSTGHSAAVIRTAYSNPLTIRLAKRSLDMLSENSSALGEDCGFRRISYLALVGNHNIDAGRTVMHLERDQGIKIHELTADDLASRFPLLNLEGVAYGILEPDSGYADPRQTTKTLVDRAKDWKLSVYEGTGVDKIRIDARGVSAVETEQGVIETPVVVNAAGGWGRQLALGIGLNYSFRWSRESDIILEVPFDTDSFPLVSDSLLRFYVRSAGPRQLMAGLGFPKAIEPLDIDNYDPNIDAFTRQRIQQSLCQRVPAAKAGSVVRGWASMYTITDDWHPLVGPEPEVPGYFACVAGSGHGFKLGPSLGESLADMIAGDEPAIDIHQLRPNRFSEGEYFTSVWGGGNRA